MPDFAVSYTACLTARPTRPSRLVGSACGATVPLHHSTVVTRRHLPASPRLAQVVPSTMQTVSKHNMRRTPLVCKGKTGG
jgi:hypothetical protein